MNRFEGDFNYFIGGRAKTGYNSSELGSIQVWSRCDCLVSCSICNICLNRFAAEEFRVKLLLTIAYLDIFNVKHV